MMPKKSSKLNTDSNSTIAATLRLMTRYHQNKCTRIARLIAHHLAWLAEYSDDPELIEEFQKLQAEWRIVVMRKQWPVSYH